MSYRVLYWGPYEHILYAQKTFHVNLSSNVVSFIRPTTQNKTIKFSSNVVGL